MVKKYSLIAILVFWIAALNAASPKELFQKANEAYKKAQYDSSIVYYKQILAQGLESPELYYNLGNAYFKTKELSQAILNFERAHQRAPHDEEISFNLQLAQTMVVDKVNILPEFFLKQWWKNIGSFLSSDGWALISISFFIIMLVSLLIYFFTKNILIKKIFFSLACVFVFISLLSVTQSCQLKQNMKSQSTAIVMTPTVNIKSSPDEKGTDIFVLHEGTKVWLTDEVGDWLKVKIADGNTGWIKKRHIERI